MMSVSESGPSPVVFASPPPPLAPQLMKSVNELRDLSNAINTFTRCYDDLQNHLDSIQNSINLLADNPTADIQLDDVSSSVPPQSPLPPASPKPNPNPNLLNQDSNRPELDILCDSMSGKGLRKYIAFNLDNEAKLRQEVPKALNLARDPAKLMLEAVGKFYLQGRKAFTKESPMISGRQAAVLLLELYLLSDCGKEVDDKVKAEAEAAAAAWRKRLILEGGISEASQIDARGLLLFIGSFGIPNVFRRHDTISLILLSHPREISDALKKSRYIFPRVSDWVHKLIKDGMSVKAVSLAYAFGLDSEIQPHAILAQHIKESKDSYDRKRREASAFPRRALEATEKHLAGLKSVIKCLKYHGIDPSNLLPNWQIKEMIVKAEKELVHIKEKVEAKALQDRQDEEMESRQKRLRYTAETSLVPSQLNVLHDGRSTAAQVDHYSSYDMGSRYVDSYSRLRDEVVVDKFGQIINLREQPYAWKIVSPSYSERVAAAQAVPGKYAIADNKYSLFGASSSLEGFPGLQVNPSTTAAPLTSFADRYQFADSVEAHTHYGNTSQQPAAATAPTQVIPNQHTSYYYQ